MKKHKTLVAIAKWIGVIISCVCIAIMILQGIFIVEIAIKLK